MPKSKKAVVRKTKVFKSFVLENRKYTLGDTLLVKSENVLPFIGDIVKLAANPSNPFSLVITVNWLYRPEEIKGGRRDYHGKDELLKSNHQDEISVRCVEGPCRVVSFADYFKERLEPEQQHGSVFYSREFYDFHEGKVIPGEPHCPCNKLYNPDTESIQCGACDEPFHVKCSPAPRNGHQEGSSGDTFLCEECTKRGIKVV